MEVFGYKGAEARIFDLKPGEKLPAGWSDAPARGYHPHDIKAGIKPLGRPKVKDDGEH